MDAVIVLLILLFVLLAIGVPVGFAIGGATMISMFFFSDLNMVVNAQYCYSGIFSFTVMAIPYFMLAGTIMSTGGIARRIVDFASALIPPTPPLWSASAVSWGPSFRPPCPLCSTELQPKPPCLISSRPVSSPAL